MAHAQKPEFVFRRKGRVYLNRRGRQFSRLLAAEVCASAVVMLDTPRSEVVWEYWLPTPFASFPFTSPPVRHRAPSGFKRTLLHSLTSHLLHLSVASGWYHSTNGALSTVDFVSASGWYLGCWYSSAFILVPSGLCLPTFYSSPCWSRSSYHSGKGQLEHFSVFPIKVITPKKSEILLRILSPTWR
jgi:hypothetical protein